MHVRQLCNWYPQVSLHLFQRDAASFGHAPEHPGQVETRAPAEKAEDLRRAEGLYKPWKNQREQGCP